MSHDELLATLQNIQPPVDALVMMQALSPQHYRGLADES